MCETLTCQKPRILFYKIQIRVLTRMNLHTTRQRLFRKLNETNGPAKRISFSHPRGIASDSVTCGDFLTWHTRMVEVGLNFLADMPDSLPCIKTFKLCLVIFILINSVTIHLHRTITIFIRISAQPRISPLLEWAPILKAEKVNKRPPLPPPNQTQISAHPHPPTWVNKFQIRDFPEDGVFFRVFCRNLALLLLRVLLLAFIVLLQNKHISLAENGENLISAQPRISVHLK